MAAGIEITPQQAESIGLGTSGGSSGGSILSGGLGMLASSNPWIAGASMIMSALSGSDVKVSAADGFASSGLGAFAGENTSKISTSAIDLTEPLTFGAALAAVVLGVYVFKRFKK